jgi:N-acetylglucosaminyldiphosphoundecaprenol N-acetyl-beta-D-mannosaminyltransferase
MNKNILGINVLFESYKGLLSTFFASGIRTYTCANHHYLNIAYEQNDYRNYLESFGVIFSDGLGSKLAAKLLYDGKKIERTTGSDFYPILLKEINAKGLPLYILGDTQKILDKAVENLKGSFPGIKICGSHQGYFDIMDKSVVDDINRKSPYLLLVGLGALRQESWVKHWKDELNVEKILVIGGWLRVISGDRKRGPLWARKMGLEWLVRLITEPRRSWKRYVVGIPLFVYRVCKQKVSILIK